MVNVLKSKKRPRLHNQPAGKCTLIASGAEAGWGTRGALARLHLLWHAMEGPVQPLSTWPKLSCTVPAAQCSKGHLLFLLTQENPSQAPSLAEGVCSNRAEKSCLSQITVPKITPMLFGGLRWPYPCLNAFYYFFFNIYIFLNGKFRGVLYTQSQVHTYIMIADKTEGVQKETFFSTNYVI